MKKHIQSILLSTILYCSYTQGIEASVAGEEVSEGVRALASYLHRSPTLTTLSLTSNNIGVSEIGVLAPCLPPALTYLDLNTNGLGPEGARILADHLPPRLTYLDLGHNKIGDYGVEALIPKLSPHLSSLHLPGNGISAAGARAIAPHLQHLQVLNFNGNRIGPKGVEILAESMPSSLVSLHLNNVGI